MKRITQKTSLFIAILLLTGVTVIASCGGASSEDSDNKEEKKEERYSEAQGYDTASADEYDYEESTAEEAEATEEYSDESENQNRPADHIEVTDRKLIKEGWLKFRTYDMEDTRSKIHSLTTKYQGFIANETQYNYHSSFNQDITVRIPSEHFDKFVSELEGGVDHFETRNIQVQDVTGEFVDTEARIKSKKEMEARYLELLQQARNVNEMLEIERQLGYIREEIESAQARMNSMKDRISYSTLHLEYYVPVEEHEYTEDEPGFGENMADAFKTGWQHVLNFFIRTATLWPWLLVFAFVGLWLRRYWRKHKNKNKQSN
jgi:hypothetical protein